MQNYKSKAVKCYIKNFKQMTEQVKKPMLEYSIEMFTVA